MDRIQRAAVSDYSRIKSFKSAEEAKGVVLDYLTKASQRIMDLIFTNDIDNFRDSNGDDPYSEYEQSISGKIIVK